MTGNPETDLESIKWFATLGVGGILASMMFWFYRMDAKRCRDDIAKFSDAWQGQSAILVDIAKDVATAITANTKTIEALHRRLDDDHLVAGSRRERIE